ncbi:carbonic anhydrase [Flavihumibacter stibioxidans]|uniref:carbonic anhydrase n=1 Tax=Flavihumibacter stibioxidans TaxID=1834163 RepID=A0ABR7MB19_9BACT|nr:carbonic anhydrase [Flavihumibacter stibioxidans]MBC6492229.1 carbonic anhydrase [Flavihumibacter stibioxidans]
MTSYDQIFENNKKWMAERKASDPAFFDKIAREQNPDYLYIGCSDSRVTAEEIMGVNPGEVFVHRNVANLVNATDLNVMTVLNYGIRSLDVKHIIVCGHYNCGGVKAAMQPVDMGILNPWFRNIRDVYRMHRNELNAINDEQLRYNRLVELNVQEQCINVLKLASLQKAYIKTGYPEVHGWVFDLHTGELIDLKLDFPKLLKDIMEIYRLTDDEIWNS